ncbi:MAG: sugar phosphate isomerase/epimerase, partial [Anaerolineales bacterium]|nr:sugar phosphate isomerase/epimerase [Anaerolineales bacterium]
DESLHVVADKITRLGYNGVELKGDLSLYTAAEVQSILRGHGLEVFSITPENVDLAHPAEPIRQDALSYYLRLLDFAAELGRPTISCHGLIGRIAFADSPAKEQDRLAQSVLQIAREAKSRDLDIVMEALNRYESHQLNTAAAALTFVNELGIDNVGVLIDAYHMNIEEADPVEAIQTAGGKLWLYHAADSNRQAIGRGHIDFAAQLQALNSIRYQGPIIVECTAPGPNPFVPIKDEQSHHWLETYLQESKTWFDQQHIV